MLNIEENAQSVYFLITALCKSIAAEQSVRLESKPLAKLRSKCYETLLKFREDANWDACNELSKEIFAETLCTYACSSERNEIEALEQQLLQVEEEPYFTTGDGNDVLKLLLALKASKSHGKVVIQPTQLLIPRAFTLLASCTTPDRVSAYKMQELTDFINPRPKYFKGVHQFQIEDSKNPYIHKSLLNGPVDQLKQIDKKYAARMGDKQSMNGMSTRSMLRPMEPAKEEEQAPIEIVSLKANESNMLVPVSASSTTEARRIYTVHWDSLGLMGVRAMKPLASEANVPLYLQLLYNESVGRPFKARVVPLKQFIKDLKSLTVGIQSDMFRYDRHFCFGMLSDITVEGVLPGTIDAFLDDYLDCGSCARRIRAMVSKRDHKLLFDGFMFKALASAVGEYLQTLNQFMFAKEDEHLMAFYKRTKKNVKQVLNLAVTLACHPRIDPVIKPPMSSKFLAYLYNEIMIQTDKNFITLLVFILKRCCHVYFKHLQKWIFEGSLDDPANEFFVAFVDYYRNDTKYFYEKAYCVIKDSVPGFVDTFDEQILQCGKYTLLLKSYKPDHPIFSLRTLDILVCLSFEEIEKLEAKCAEYLQEARELLGPPVTARQIFEARTEQRRNFIQQVSKRSRENMERWIAEQLAVAQKTAAEKEHRFNEAKMEREEAQKLALSQKMERTTSTLQLLKDKKNHLAEEDYRLNINLKKRYEYFTEVSDTLKEQLKTDDENKHKLQVILSPRNADDISISSADADDTLNTTLKPDSTEAVSTSPRSLVESPHAQTSPISNADTDFESCFGDEEATTSEYGECISNENILMNADSTNLLSVSYSVSGMLKRSTSDVINSNELPAKPLDDEQRNRDNAMSGSSMSLCLKSVDEKAVTNAPLLDFLREEKPPSVQLTDAQRNKLRVMSEEYGTFHPTLTTKSLPDINLNTLPETELSELQRNRKRMMQTDTFSEYNKDPFAARPNLNLNFDTERARNRRKVLASEYDLPIELRTKIAANVETETPMSTTSDTPLTEVAKEVPNEKQSDLANGNLPKNNSRTNLKLKMLGGVENKVDCDIDDIVLHTAATLPQTTPEYALNTAGIAAKHGFDFSCTNRSSTREFQSLSIVAQCKEQCNLDNTVDYSYVTEPYKRCWEIINSSFRCPPRCAPFALSSQFIAAGSGYKMCIGSNDSRTTLSRNHLNNMSTITLTEFLRKSVVIPLSAHFEILNTEVMRLFLQDLHLIDHLRSLRNYFFLMDGEYSEKICDNIIGALENGAKPDSLFNYGMLHAILEKALGGSITGKEKNARNLTFTITPGTEEFDLLSPDALKALSLAYDVHYPLNIILSDETIKNYASIFQHLFKVRRISWVLESCHQMLKEVAKQHGKALLQSPQYRHVLLITHKIYNYVHALQNHITANALQSSWKTFKDELMNARSIDDIYRKHATYIKRIRFLCMLNRQSVEFFRTIENIFTISLQFYQTLKSRQFKLRHSNSRSFTHSRYDKLAHHEKEFEKGLNFTIYLGNKIVERGYQPEIGLFINLINYNDYYVVDVGKNT